MNWFQQLQYKTRVGIVLTVLISVILLNNITGQKSFDDMGQSVSSIYKDRLLPATYIFELTNHLYQEQLLLAQPKTAQVATQMQQHHLAIAGLMKKYEATYLTREEQIEWVGFKAALQIYNQQPQPSAQGFDQLILRLNVLSNIQAGEGGHLKDNTRALLSAYSIRYSLEMGLVIILAAITLVLIGASKQTFVPQLPHRPSMN